VLTLTLDDFLWFVDDCLDAMLQIATALGDDLANEALEAPGSNSPFAILTHSLGVVEWWSGEMVAGIDVERDREAEFTARGPVSELPDAVRRTRARLLENLTALDSAAPPARPGDVEMREYPYGRTQGAVLLHVFHELAQHRGQMEVTRDLLLNRRAPGGP
jgi:uncharacterized damage-inducible protein DinB